MIRRQSMCAYPVYHEANTDTWKRTCFAVEDMALSSVYNFIHVPLHIQITMRLRDRIVVTMMRRWR